MKRVLVVGNEELEKMAATILRDGGHEVELALPHRIARSMSEFEPDVIITLSGTYREHPICFAVLRALKVSGVDVPTVVFQVGASDITDEAEAILLDRGVEVIAYRRDVYPADLLDAVADVGQIPDVDYDKMPCVMLRLEEGISLGVEEALADRGYLLRGCWHDSDVKPVLLSEPFPDVVVVRWGGADLSEGERSIADRTLDEVERLRPEAAVIVYSVVEVPEEAARLLYERGVCDILHVSEGHEELAEAIAEAVVK